jgi:hypothetical protein
MRFEPKHKGDCEIAIAGGNVIQSLTAVVSLIAIDEGVAGERRRLSGGESCPVYTHAD